MLLSYQLNYLHIFELSLLYIPIQYLPNNIFGFSFRVVKEKFYKNDQIKFSSIVASSKHNEIALIISDIESTLRYYDICNEFYQNTVKYLTEDILKEYLKGCRGIIIPTYWNNKSCKKVVKKITPCP